MTQRRIYQDEYPYFITFRTREGYQLFEDEKMVELLSDIIFNAGEIKRYDILAYQIMPDHVHLLVQYNRIDRINWFFDRTLERVLSEVGNGDLFLKTKSTFSNMRSVHEYTISNLIQSIKGNFSRKLHMGNIWQRRFYARIVNNDKYLGAVTNYIKQNPIKQDLPRKYNQQPYQYLI